jgi:putative Mn2+ efflux pump MntP
MSAGDILTIIFIAIGLSADCFAVALGAGVSGKDHSRSGIFRVALSFGLFQALMPVLGWLAGRTVVDIIAAYDHWVAFGLLAVISGKMLWESFHHERGPEKETDITRGFLLITLSVATSIDALAVGLSFAFLKINIALASPIIGVVAFIVTVIGFILGRKVGGLIGRWAEVAGAVILLAIALRILLSHLLG